MRYLVTGAAGFIGNNLVKLLLNNGHDVVGMDNFVSGQKVNITALQNYNNFKFIEKDICDKKALENVKISCDVIIHLAADVSVQRSVIDPANCIEQNVIGTINVASMAKSWDAKVFIFASSCAVYGNQNGLCSENNSVTGQQSTYGVSKLSCEQILPLILNNDCKYYALRFFNIFGPHQMLDSDYGAVIPNWINNILDGNPIKIYGSGKQTRDFVFVKDLCKIIYLLSFKKDYSRSKYILNIGTGKSISLLDLAKMMFAISSKTQCQTVPILHNEARDGDVLYSFCDNSSLLRQLDNFSFSKMPNAIYETFEYFKGIKN